MPNQPNISNNEPRTVQDIIDTIEVRSADGFYYYRGEPECYEKVSSELFRALQVAKAKSPGIKVFEAEILRASKAYIDKRGDPEIRKARQQFGDKANLIHFTMDYDIALFFACESHPKKDGRIILQAYNAVKDWTQFPMKRETRSMVQRCQLVRPPKGFIEPHANEIVCIPASLKQPILQHLRDYHGISKEIIYCDNHKIGDDGFFGIIALHFYQGFAHYHRAHNATVLEGKKAEYEKSIEHYTEALDINPDFPEAYYSRGSAYHDLGEVNLAIKDYSKAIELNPEYPKAYLNRGVAYDQKGAVERAIEDWTKAIELNPDYVLAYNNRGNAYFYNGDVDLAMKDFAKVVELNPDYALDYFCHGETWRYIQEWGRSNSFGNPLIL